MGVNCSVVEAVSLSEDVASELALTQPQFRFEMAMIFASKRPTIGPRSRSWSVVDRSLIDWRRFHHVNSPIAARSRRDRGSIGPRSWSSSTKPLNRPMRLQLDE